MLLETQETWMKNFEDAGPSFDVFLKREQDVWRVGVYVPPFDDFNPEKAPK
jgi:hypothetical protein